MTWLSQLVPGHCFKFNRKTFWPACESHSNEFDVDSAYMLERSFTRFERYSHSKHTTGTCELFPSPYVKCEIPGCCDKYLDTNEPPMRHVSLMLRQLYEDGTWSHESVDLMSTMRVKLIQKEPLIFEPVYDALPSGNEAD